MAAAIGVLALAWQWRTLPRMAPSGSASLGTLLEVMRRPQMARGMVAVLLVFVGHFAFFTYLRPFLEHVAGVGVNGLSAILLGFGVANFAGTSLAGALLQRNLRLTLLLMPLAMGLMGLAFGTVPVTWSTWITVTVPDEAESGGGLLVAIIQLSIAVGAAAGGAVFDASGARGVCLAATMYCAGGRTDHFHRTAYPSKR